LTKAKEKAPYTIICRGGKAAAGAIKENGGEFQLGLNLTNTKWKVGKGKEKW